MSLTIRVATPSDAAALAELARRTFAETFADGSTAEDMTLHLSTSYSLSRQAEEIADPAIDVLLADDSGTLAGYAQVRGGPTPPCVHSNAPIELWRFYVDRPWQGRGIATALMDEVLDAARARGAGALWLSVWEHNARALAFYRKCGFACAGTKLFLVGTDAQTDWVMVRPVDVHSPEAT